jgi:hypothetical protein
MAFLGVVRKIYPAISGLASLGGPFGTIAAGLVGKAIGVDKVDPTPDGIAAAVAGATPEQMIALQQAEADAALKAKEMGFANTEAMFALADADAASARNREIQIRDKTPEIGFYLLIAAFLALIYYLFRYPVPDANKGIVFGAAGTLGTLVIGAAQYFYGTTRSSQQKDATIADIAKQP